MKPLLRSLGSAVLAVALLNASAGLCFCHRGPVAPGADAGSGGCCHGPGRTDLPAVSAPMACCHIESAESAVTPVVVVKLAPPAVALTSPADHSPAAVVASVVFGTSQSASPPLFALRI
jgi:hypothetical protein